MLRFFVLWCWITLMFFVSEDRKRIWLTKLLAHYDMLRGPSLFVKIFAQRRKKEISPNFLVLKFCGNTQFPQSFRGFKDSPILEENNLILKHNALITTSCLARVIAGQLISNNTISAKIIYVSRKFSSFVNSIHGIHIHIIHELSFVFPQIEK